MCYVQVLLKCGQASAAAVIAKICLSRFDISASVLCDQEGPLEESDEVSTAASTTEEEEPAESSSPDSPRLRPRRLSQNPGAAAPKRPSALKGSSMRRKPQLDRINESSGGSNQSSTKEEDMLQVCA